MGEESMKRTFAARLIQAFLAVVVVTVCVACDPPLTSEEVLADGPYPARDILKTFKDTERGRTIRATIWFPGTSPDGPEEVARSTFPHPLIVYSHGFSSFMGEGTYLNRHLATHGYIVIEPQFPYTNISAPGGPDLSDVVNQPGDLSFMIDKMLAWNEEPGNLFEGTVDPDRIGATGLSLGGLTTLLVAFHPELRDPRIKAAAATGAPTDLFAKRFYRTARVPLMLLLSKLDAMIDYEAAFPIAKQNVDVPTFIVTFFEASHTGWSTSALGFESVPNPDTIGCDAIADQLPTDPNEFEQSGFDLGGPGQGILPSTSRPPCSYGTQLLTSIRPSLQHQLTILAIRPFFDTYLKEPSQLGLINYFRSLTYLLGNLQDENADEIEVLPILRGPISRRSN